MKRFVLCLLSACVLAATASAHVLDQYLQIAQITLAPEGVRVELRLLPGVQAAECIFALLDTNRDGELSTTEQQAYAQRVRQDLALTINQQPAPLALADAQFPARAALNEGLGAIRLTFTAQAALNAADNQQLHFHNRHWPALSVYLVNALVPATEAIKITGQERDALQRGLQLHFQVRPATTSARRRGIGLWLLGLGLALGVLSWKHLRRFSLRPKTQALPNN